MKTVLWFYVLTLGELRTGFVKRSRWRMHRKLRNKLEVQS